MKTKIINHRRCIEVQCKECGIKYLKLLWTIKQWSGICKKCNTKRTQKIGKIKNIGRKCSLSTKMKISKALNKKGAKPKCLYCNKLTNQHHYKYHWDCYLKVNRGEKHPGWKGGPPHCIDCGKEINRGGYKRCNRCAKKGELSSNWKGGITPLRELIRGLSEHRKWSYEVYKRDNFTCQECGKRGGKLEAHHKKSFSDIYYEFLKEYSQFSPIEDKETLARLAITYKPFWDVDNGKTYCHKCHQKTDNYFYKGVKKWI